MEVQASTDSVNTEVAPIETSTESTQQSTAPVEQSTEAAPVLDATGNPVPPAYQPNFKFKVKDQEKEIDEWLRPVVKDAETEKKLKELHERAFGLDEVKSSRDSFKTKYEDVNTKYTGLEKSLQTLSGYVQRGDYDSFFQSLQIPKESILKYAINELRYNELPQDQKAQIDQQKRFQQEQYAFQSQSEQHAAQMREFGMQQLNFEMSKPDVSQVVQSFDQRMGPGAFQREVINRGAYYEQVHGKTLPASQLISEVLAIVSPSAGQQAVPPSASAQAAQTTPSQGVQPQQEAKPTVKVFQGGGNASPVKKQINSLDDLRKLREQPQE